MMSNAPKFFDVRVLGFFSKPRLDISQSNNTTLIKLVSNGQVLASLIGVAANTINATDFAF